MNTIHIIRLDPNENKPFGNFTNTGAWDLDDWIMSVSDKGYKCVVKTLEENYQVFYKDKCYGASSVVVGRPADLRIKGHYLIFSAPDERNIDWESLDENNPEHVKLAEVKCFP